MQEYQGILFPERAENLEEFRGYKTFLDHWDPLATRLRGFYEGVALRRDTRCLGVFGPQGSGKTLFARTLISDFERAREDAKNAVSMSDPNNLWHRITGGISLAPELIARATSNTVMFHIEDDKDWRAKAIAFKNSNRDRHCVIVADNSERAYFRQALVQMNDTEYVKLGHEPETIRLAAQRLVALCRTELRGTLFVLLSNDDLFLLAFEESIESQHSGLMTLESLPLPGPRDKETVVRVNTNRLNRISYWYCLDKAGPDEKIAVHSALNGASTFPESFAAVDSAIRLASPQRVGRPARKCVVTLIVLTDRDVFDSDPIRTLGVADGDPFLHEWMAITTFKSRWTEGIIERERERALLESEWQLRVVSLGNEFVKALLSADGSGDAPLQALVGSLQEFHGPGTQAVTRLRLANHMRDAVNKWPDYSEVDLTDFWERGQSRSEEYEARLRVLLQGYDTGSEGFLSYRPDYVVSPFKPCSILSAMTAEIQAINSAIRRDAHVFEFAAIRAADVASVKAYLAGKLSNYVDITQEQ